MVRQIQVEVCDVPIDGEVAEMMLLMAQLEESWRAINEIRTRALVEKIDREMMALYDGDAD